MQSSRYGCHETRNYPPPEPTWLHVRMALTVQNASERYGGNACIRLTHHSRDGVKKAHVAPVVVGNLCERAGDDAKKDDHEERWHGLQVLRQLYGGRVNVCSLQNSKKGRQMWTQTEEV